MATFDARKMAPGTRVPHVMEHDMNYYLKCMVLYYYL